MVYPLHETGDPAPEVVPVRLPDQVSAAHKGLPELPPVDPSGKLGRHPDDRDVPICGGPGGRGSNIHHLARTGVGSLDLLMQLLERVGRVEPVHDFDIYFWLNGDVQPERKAWFELEYSAVRRMPRHFREHPWDLSSSFLTLVQTGPSVVDVGRRLARRVEIAHRGDALVYNWSVTDIFAVLADGRRVPAGELGAHLETHNGQPGGGALDGNPSTRWTTGSKRLDGMWIRLVFDRAHDEIVRLELDHMPLERDFPNALSAKVQADDGPWVDLPAKAATPRLRWNPLIFGFAASGLLLILLAARRGTAPPGPGCSSRSSSGGPRLASTSSPEAPEDGIGQPDRHQDPASGPVEIALQPSQEALREPEPEPFRALSHKL